MSLEEGQSLALKFTYIASSRSDHITLQELRALPWGEIMILLTFTVRRGGFVEYFAAPRKPPDETGAWELSFLPVDGNFTGTFNVTETLSNGWLWFVNPGLRVVSHSPNVLQMKRINTNSVMYVRFHHLREFQLCERAIAKFRSNQGRSQASAAATVHAASRPVPLALPPSHGTAATASANVARMMDADEEDEGSDDKRRRTNARKDQTLAAVAGINDDAHAQQDDRKPAAVTRLPNRRKPFFLSNGETGVPSEFSPRPKKRRKESHENGRRQSSVVEENEKLKQYVKKLESKVLSLKNQIKRTTERNKVLEDTCSRMRSVLNVTSDERETPVREPEQIPAETSTTKRRSTASSSGLPESQHPIERSAAPVSQEIRRATKTRAKPKSHSPSRRPVESHHPQTKENARLGEPINQARMPMAGAVAVASYDNYDTQTATDGGQKRTGTGKGKASSSLHRQESQVATTVTEKLKPPPPPSKAHVAGRTRRLQAMQFPDCINGLIAYVIHEHGTSSHAVSRFQGNDALQSQLIMVLQQIDESPDDWYETTGYRYWVQVRGGTSWKALSQPDLKTLANFICDMIKRFW